MAQTNGPKIVISLWFLTVISFFFMLLRFYCKTRYSKLFGWDDWLLALSWVLCLAYTVLGQASVSYDVGKHFLDADPFKLITGVKYMYFSELMGLLAMPIGKTSFCVTLLRLTAINWHKWILWFILLSINATMGAVAIMTFAQCSPVEKLWDITLTGTCWDNRIVIYFSIFVGAYSCLMDFLLALCPWMIIHKLQMNRKEKLSIIFAMSMGCLAGVACAVKTSYLPLIGTWSDFTYNIADVLIWGLTESSITIVAASIPFMRLMFKEISSYSSSRGRSQGQSNSYYLATRTIGSMKNGARAKVDVYNQELSPRHDDEASDKSILGGSIGNLDMGKILQTNEVRVEWDVASNNGRYGKGPMG